MDEKLEARRRRSREASRRYRERHPERVQEQKRAYRERNAEWLHSEEFRKTVRAAVRKHYWKDPKKRNASSMRSMRKRLYGLTHEAFLSLIEAQGGLCPICWRELEGVARIAVDHDHATGKVRGVLHSPCNTMLGLASDDVERLRRAADYLERNR